MKKIFLGMILILFGFSVNLGNYIFEVTPDFIGSLLFLSALKDFALSDEKRFKLPLQILTGLFVAIYIAQIFQNELFAYTWLKSIYSLARAVILQWALYVGIKIIQCVEVEHSCQLKGTAIFNTWKFLFIFNIVITGISSLVLYHIPKNITIFQLIFLPLIIVLLLGAIIGIVVTIRMIMLLYWNS